MTAAQGFALDVSKVSLTNWNEWRILPERVPFTLCRAKKLA